MARETADRGSRKARARRLAIAAAVAALVHVAAWLVLAPPFRLGAQAISPGPADVPATAIVVDLVRPSPWASRAAQPSPDHPAPQKPQSQDKASTPTGSPAPPGPSEPGAAGSPSNGDALFRVPFRDAVGQASSELRAGLRCAHVDVRKLPAWMQDQCAAKPGQLPAWVISGFALDAPGPPLPSATPSHSPPAR